MAGNELRNVQRLSTMREREISILINTLDIDRNAPTTPARG